MQKVIKKALALPDFDSIGAQNRMAPRPRTAVRPPGKEGRPNKGAVMVILYPADNILHTLLIKRQDHLSYHPGQISFPGGSHESGETFIETALRETHEEVNIPPEQLTLLGTLQPVYVAPSDFMVYPFVAWHDHRPAWTPDPAEVAEVIEARICDFLDKGSHGSETRIIQGTERHIPFFRLKAHQVWGATAMLLNELLERLNAVGFDGWITEGQSPNKKGRL